METMVGLGTIWCRGCNSRTLSACDESCACGWRNPAYRPKREDVPWGASTKTPKSNQAAQAAQTIAES